MAQRKTLDIDKGLFVLRYASAEDAARPPIIKVWVNPADAANASLVVHPDAADGTLWQPGSCTIVKAIRPATLVVEVQPLEEGGSVTGSVQIEPIPYKLARPVLAARSLTSLDLSGFRLTGHVAGVGDTAVGPNTWIAGPNAPSRIEGLTLAWPQKPAGLEIRYMARVAQHRGPEPSFVPLGAFVGTRGQARALTGVIFELSGPAASAVDFAVEGAFLGSTPMRVSGKRVVLSGPTGREPLIGLRVNLTLTGADEAPAPAPAPVVEAPPPRAQPSSSRVRVFRSRKKEG